MTATAILDTAAFGMTCLAFIRARRGWLDLTRLEAIASGAEL